MVENAIFAKKVDVYESNALEFIESFPLLILSPPLEKTIHIRFSNVLKKLSKNDTNNRF